jgi:hypothetical protein
MQGKHISIVTHMSHQGVPASMRSYREHCGTKRFTVCARAMATPAKWGMQANSRVATRQHGVFQPNRRNVERCKIMLALCSRAGGTG